MDCDDPTFTEDARNILDLGTHSITDENRALHSPIAPMTMGARKSQDMFQEALTGTSASDRQHAERLHHKMELCHRAPDSKRCFVGQGPWNRSRRLARVAWNHDLAAGSKGVRRERDSRNLLR
jgi:hypothetical protein